MDLSALRREYTQKGFDITELNVNPFEQFRIWVNIACQANLLEPNAMILSTVDKDHYPQSRTLLLKECDFSGFTFFTNYNSDKSKQLDINPKASLLFLWLELERQIRIVGHVEKVSESLSLRYFRSRPRNSQLGAWSSVFQSSPLASRKQLEQEYKLLEERFKDDELIPLPPFWGGYKLIPKKFEFWQGRQSRLHDRFLYEKKMEASETWSIQQLYS